MAQSGTNRVRKLTRNSDQKQILLNESAIVMCVANTSNIAYSDITYEAGPNRNVTVTFRKSMASLRHGTENLILVTYNGVSTLINATRILNTFSADGDEDTAAQVVYNMKGDGASTRTLLLSQTLQNVKDLVDALGNLAASVS